MAKYKLSVIIPFFNEEDGVDQCFKTLIPILDDLKNEYEVVCIDDGSADKTHTLLTKWSEKNSAIKVLKFARNFGKEAALTAGFDNVEGDCVIPMDADLQDPPSQIPLMIKKWQEGYDIVAMKRSSRDESFFKKVFAKIFYKYVAKMCKIPMESEVGDFRLLDKKVVKVLVLLKEKNRFYKGLLSWPGFKTTTLKYNRPRRVSGKEKMSFIKCVSLALDGIFSFSIVPIRIFTLFGFICSLSAMALGLWIIYQKLFIGIAVQGYASLITAIVFLGGVILLGIGILGEYIGRIYTEVKNRPIYVLDEESKSND